jgi:PAS domain S-box-containing protein
VSAQELDELVLAAREAERRARETEARFRIMADAAPVLLWMARTDALCTFFNQTWLDFTGRTLEQEWGVGWAEGVHFEDFQRCVDTYMAAFAERRQFEMEYRLRRADGQFRWVLDRGTPRWEPDGRFAGYIGSCVDITDRKDLELDLVRSVSVRDEFLSIASHELRTPLTALRLQLDSVARSLELRPQAHLANGRLADSTNDALTQVARLTALVERLLDISRFSEGRLRLDLEELDLVALVRGTVEVMRGTAALAGSELRFAGPAALHGRWDRVRVEQVVMNLVGNAAKFGARQPIEVRVEEHDGAARVTVGDRGIGIDPQHQRRIFGRFERGVSARHFGGLGLGLWVAKQIVDAHDGTITVESAPGEGATFTVLLPRAAAQQARRTA